MTESDPNVALASLAIFLIVYFLPTIIARSKGCVSKGKITGFSLLLGWFPFVWFICLIWAVVGKTEKNQIVSAKILAEAIVAAQRAAA